MVVPCFNCGPYILKALESFERGFDLLQMLVDSKVCMYCSVLIDVTSDIALVQGLAHVNGEVIIVDDASTDNSTWIVENFMSQDGEYAGRSAGRNWFAYRVAASIVANRLLRVMSDG